MASSASARASGGKRVVSQDELRRLMREKQRLSTNRKRVDSPLARYNRWGQLSCALCNTAVKSELLWPTHVLGKQHREKVAGLKDAKDAAEGPSGSAAPQSAKRRAPDAGGRDAKRAKGPPVPRGAPSTAGDHAGKEPPRATPAKAPGLGLLPDYEEDEDEDEEEEGGGQRPGGAGQPRAPGRERPLSSPREAAPSGAPPGELAPARPPKAPPIPHSGSIEKADGHDRAVERRENTAEALPEGFFDDPEIDAKVRKVDAPKDQMDKEWDEFQRAMRQVSTISEAIVAEEDEEGRLDRQIGEIDEQIECYRRVENLRNRQDEIKHKLREVLTIKELQKKEEENVGSDDEGELQDLLSQDWRVKGALL